MSGCIEREMSKVILMLPTKYEHVKIFEQKVLGGFSSVNLRFAFDSQILLPNLTNEKKLETDSVIKNLNYKVVYDLKINDEKVKKE